MSKSLLLRALIATATLFSVVVGIAVKIHTIDTSRIIEHHSIEPPLLDQYFESGLHSWSFGGATVVANDYVRLTPAAGEGHGYFWNQFPSGLKSWEANFTLRAKARTHWSVFSPKACENCGVGFWYLEEPSRHSDSQFFGVPASFKGVGVVLPSTQKKIVVVKNEGDGEGTLESLSIGSCSAYFSGVMNLNLQVAYSHVEGTLTVAYSYGDAERLTDCGRKFAVTLSERSYFGFTAMSSSSTEIAFDLTRMLVAPADGETEDAKIAGANNEKAAHEFDAALEKEDRKYWTENGDVDPDGGAASSHNQRVLGRHRREAQPQPQAPNYEEEDFEGQ